MVMAMMMVEREGVQSQVKGERGSIFLGDRHRKY